MNFTGSGDLFRRLRRRITKMWILKSMIFMVVQIDFMANFKCLWDFMGVGPSDRVSPLGTG